LLDLWQTVHCRSRNKTDSSWIKTLRNLEFINHVLFNIAKKVMNNCDAHQSSVLWILRREVKWVCSELKDGGSTFLRNVGANYSY
jgi:hypothetical protein